MSDEKFDMLTDEEKTKIKEYLCNPECNLHPDTYIPKEKREEALAYGKFIANKETLRMWNKLAKKITE